MRKREILRHYKSSLEKWEQILGFIIRKEKKPYSLYWTSCGFCEVHGTYCKKCPLEHINKSKMPYCYDGNVIRSVAGNILMFAIRGEWPKAEKLCKQFIAKIKREIKKVENR